MRLMRLPWENLPNATVICTLVVLFHPQCFVRLLPFLRKSHSYGSFPSQTVLIKDTLRSSACYCCKFSIISVQIQATCGSNTYVQPLNVTSATLTFIGINISWCYLESGQIDRKYSWSSRSMCVITQSRYRTQQYVLKR